MGLFEANVGFANFKVCSSIVVKFDIEKCLNQSSFKIHNDLFSIVEIF